jgi:ElaB/YqjD/DUF883 family membrane-anchored ribosome-binding protein
MGIAARRSEDQPNKEHPMSQVNTDQLIEDLKAVVHDAEALLKATAGMAGEHIAQIRAKAEASLRSARAQLASAVGGNAAASVREAAHRADRYARDNPWLAIGAGAAVGLVVGLLLGRRDRGDSR